MGKSVQIEIMETTYSKRPDLLIEENLSSKEKKVLEEIKVKGKNKTS